MRVARLNPANITASSPRSAANVAKNTGLNNEVLRRNAALVVFMMPGIYFHNDHAYFRACLSGRDGNSCIPLIFQNCFSCCLWNAKILWKNGLAPGNSRLCTGGEDAKSRAYSPRQICLHYYMAMPASTRNRISHQNQGWRNANVL